MLTTNKNILNEVEKFYFKKKNLKKSKDTQTQSITKTSKHHVKNQNPA